MAAFPFKYYVALRDEYIAEMAVVPPAPKEDDEGTVIDFDKEVLRGELV